MIDDSQSIDIPTPTPRPTPNATAEFGIPLEYMNITMGNEMIQGWHSIGIGQQIQGSLLVVTFFLCTMIIVITFKKMFGSKG